MNNDKQGGIRSTSIYASAVQFAYNFQFKPIQASARELIFDQFVGRPPGYNITMVIYSKGESATVIGGFDDDSKFAINAKYTNRFGTDVDYVIFLNNAADTVNINLSPSCEFSLFCIFLIAMLIYINISKMKNKINYNLILLILILKYCKCE
jgi:hypothetical protein